MRSFFDPWTVSSGISFTNLLLTLISILIFLLFWYVGGLLMSKKHPGFKAVQNKIAKKEGVSKKAAGAILANSSRNASSKAKKTNPKLRKVK